MVGSLSFANSQILCSVIGEVKVGAKSRRQEEKSDVQMAFQNENQASTGDLKKAV